MRLKISLRSWIPPNSQRCKSLYSTSSPNPLPARISRSLNAHYISGITSISVTSLATMWKSSCPSCSHHSMRTPRAIGTGLFHQLLLSEFDLKTVTLIDKFQDYSWHGLQRDETLYGNQPSTVWRLLSRIYRTAKHCRGAWGSPGKEMGCLGRAGKRATGLNGRSYRCCCTPNTSYSVATLRWSRRSSNYRRQPEATRLPATSRCCCKTAKCSRETGVDIICQE